MILLGVNIDHVATLRQARYRDEENTFGGFVEPDPAQMAWLAEEAGADGITMHVREDRRHVQVEDVQRYQEKMKTRLNLETSKCKLNIDVHCMFIERDRCLFFPHSKFQ